MNLQSVVANDIRILTGDGSDMVSLLEVMAPSVAIDTGRHRDTVIINELTRCDLLFVQLGEGDNDLLGSRRAGWSF